ncbi:PREDICTED: proline-rich extensin-like protein EPR1, partial [Ceratotherium simum simum]|uniref:Proline-rich extensin-like protein EPR1 n=1 Tax=Ceratotherium simum simum TaxID=73337 RepID=A0ABM1C731_CERSS
MSRPGLDQRLGSPAWGSPPAAPPPTPSAAPDTALPPSARRSLRGDPYAEPAAHRLPPTSAPPPAQRSSTLQKGEIPSAENPGGRIPPKPLHKPVWLPPPHQTLRLQCAAQGSPARRPLCCSQPRFCACAGLRGYDGNRWGRGWEALPLRAPVLRTRGPPR